jgi:hypothetical protein
MSSTYLKTLVLILITLLLIDCSHQYYTPNAEPIPLFTEKKRLQGSGYLGFANNVTTVSGSIAYSLTSHFAMMATYQGASGNIATTTNHMQDHYGEAAAGYYNPFGKFYVWEIYGGAGLDGQHHSYDTTNAYLRFTKYFIQPVIGIKLDHFQAGISARMSYIDFSRIQSVFVIDGQPMQRGYLFFEPAFTLRWGLKHIKFQFQRQYSLTTHCYHPAFDYTNSLTNLGIQFVLPWKSETQQKGLLRYIKNQ